MYYRNTVKGNSNKWEQSHLQTHRHTATTNNRNGVEKIEVIKTLTRNNEKYMHQGDQLSNGQKI